MSIGRRWLLPIVVGLVGALVVGIAWWVDQRDRVDVGLVETTADVMNANTSDTSFVVPGGRLQVDVAVGAETDEELRAPRDGALVEVTVRGTADRAGSRLESRRAPAGTSTVWLRAGDRRVRVADDVSLDQEHVAPEDKRPDAVVAVPGSGRNLVVEVEFAGRRQSVALATGKRVLGSFASLYRPGPVTRFIGPDVNGSSSHDGFEWYETARGGYERRPYVRGLGWAKPGKEWLVVGVTSLRVSGIARGSTSQDEERHRYEPEPLPDGRGRLTVEDGRVVRKPSSTVSPGGSEASYDPGNPVFEIDRGAATALRFTISTPVRSDDPEARPRTGRIVATRTVPVDAVAEPGADR